MATKEDVESDAQEGVRAPLMVNVAGSASGSGGGNLWMVYLSTFVAICGSYEFGCCAGYSSPTQSAIQEDLSLTLSEYSVFGSILTFGAMVGAITIGPIADFLGRKGALRVSCAFCVAGWLAIYFSKAAWLLDIGRLLTGYGMGAFSYVVPIFVAEIAPKNLRGRLTAANQLMIVTGVSASFIIGVVVSWRTLALIGLIPCAVTLLGLFFIPESPRWLAKTGRHQDFEDALQKLRGKDADISEEAEEIQDYIATLDLLPKAKFLDLFQRRYWSSLIIGVGLMFCQQLGGINGVCFYVSDIFEQAGFSSSIGTITYAILQVIVTGIAAGVMDKAGRKPLILVSATEVFYYAQKAVLHPTGPLFDQETQTLKDQCVRALKRIFILCDHDRDGALSDAELNDFQVKCFNAPLQPSEIVGVKRVVQEKLPEGVNEHGLTLTGFLFLHALFIEKGRLETTWTVLRKFGYNNDIRLADELIPSLPKRSPDQSVELTNEAIEFLKANFELFDGDGDGALRPRELEELFSTAPASPFSELPSKDAAFGGLSLDGFLSQWALMTLLNPASTMENLIYIGYPGEVSSAIRVTRKKRVDRKKQQSERNVFQCFVFGPKKAGKSALLDSFLGRPFSETYNPTTEERYAVNVVDQPGGPKKTLVMREIPEDGVKKFLRNKEALAACDIAVFVHDSSDESSWKRATELLVEVASHGETTGFEVPCLIVAAKDDLDAFPSAIQHSTRVSQDMGTEAPIPISAKLGDFNNVFRKIVTAAEHPHLSIPETEAGRTRKQYHKILNRSLMFISVGAAVAMVGVAAYRVYAARRNASG